MNRSTCLFNAVVLALAMMSFCQQRGLTKILVDATGQTNRMSVMAAYDHASILAKDVYLKRAKHAIISPEHPENSLVFLETAAINRGASVRLFPTREHALSWLIE